jgi:hypothetical protein
MLSLRASITQRAEKNKINSSNDVLFPMFLVDDWTLKGLLKRTGLVLPSP